VKNRHIYVVDDSELVLSLATKALEEAGYLPLALDDWHKLDAALEQLRPALILMDINMPETTGDFVLSFFKEQRGLTDVPILLFSDIDENELQERAEACGADGYVSKGWGFEKMVESVTETLGGL
jgi:two-component system sensor histidine kinase ChiS